MIFAFRGAADPWRRSGQRSVLGSDNEGNDPKLAAPRRRPFRQDLRARAQIDGRWESVSLADLPPPRALAHVIRFLEEGIWPAYVKGELLEE